MSTSCDTPLFFGRYFLSVIEVKSLHEQLGLEELVVTALEKLNIRLGFMPLTDCAPLVIAKEKGFFAKHGLSVDLCKQTSWSSIRDHVLFGGLDAAHMLASMPIATTLGVGTAKRPMITALTMALNGNGITVSHELYARMLEADANAMRQKPVTAYALKKVIEEDRKAGVAPMTFATVFPVSTHNYELRYWMASAGIDPDRDVRLVVIPPPFMVANLESREIVGFCVGEPWNQLAVKSGIGRTLITKYEIWNNSPEKVLGVTEEWANKNPNTHRALLKSIIEAAVWIDRIENRLEVAQILSRDEYVGAPVDVVKMSMTGTFQYARHLPPQPLPDFNVFSRYTANFPWLSHAQWFISQMYRWGQIEQPIDINSLAASVYRPDIYAQAAKDLSIEVPKLAYKCEGKHQQGWEFNENQNLTMGSDRFFDGKLFDPFDIVNYLFNFDISHIRVNRPDLEAMNTVYMPEEI